MKYNNFSKINTLNKDLLKKLSKKKIYFGHQSVGYEIVEGIKYIQTKNSDINWNIFPSSNSKDFSKYNFIHSEIGSNFDPISKINAFAKYQNKGIGNVADYSFFKFCFVDVDKNTNVKKIFNYYKKTMENLKAKYPKTTYIHFTMPLVSEKVPFKTKLKNFIKIFIGRYIVNSKLNSKRTEFNELIRSEYQPKGNLFDIAKIESTKPDNNREQYNEKNESYYSMYEGYTYDGGHLNIIGRRVIAESLIEFLAKKNK